MPNKRKPLKLGRGGGDVEARGLHSFEVGNWMSCTRRRGLGLRQRAQCRGQLLCLHLLPLSPRVEQSK